MCYVVIYDVMFYDIRKKDNFYTQSTLCVCVSDGNRTRAFGLPVRRVNRYTTVATLCSWNKLARECKLGLRKTCVCRWDCTLLILYNNWWSFPVQQAHVPWGFCHLLAYNSSVVLSHGLSWWWQWYRHSVHIHDLRYRFGISASIVNLHYRGIASNETWCCVTYSFIIPVQRAHVTRGFCHVHALEIASYERKTG